MEDLSAQGAGKQGEQAASNNTIALFSNATFLNLTFGKCLVNLFAIDRREVDHFRETMLPFL